MSDEKAKQTQHAQPASMPAGPVDVQQKLDDWLASNPEAQKYVSKLYYVPEGQPAPADVTHVNVLSSTVSAERHLTIGIVAKPPYGAFLDMLLGMLATQPPPAL